MSTIPQPPGGGDPGRRWRDLNREMETADSLAAHLENRVAAIEEVLAARWPRRAWLAARLGRRLRASVRHFHGGSWIDRRTDAASVDWLSQR